MRISDWSSDVCSSDLTILSGDIETVIVVTAQDCRAGRNGALRIDQAFAVDEVGPQRARGTFDIFLQSSDRKSVVKGKSVSVRVDPGGRRIIKNKKHTLVGHRTSYTPSEKQSNSNDIQKNN